MQFVVRQRLHDDAGRIELTCAPRLATALPRRARQRVARMQRAFDVLTKSSASKSSAGAVASSASCAAVSAGVR